MYMPISYQIQDILENHDLFNDLNYKMDRQKKNKYAIEDIYDGVAYHKLANDASGAFLSITFNCDGVPIFKSSKYAIWPIL